MNDATQKCPFRDVGWFVLRTPLLPLNKWLSWCNLATADARAPDRSEQLQRDHDILRQALGQHIDGILLEAMYLSSSDLSFALESWRKKRNPRKDQSIENTLVALFTRMCSRSTPFGLSAGIAVGRIGSSTQLCVPPLSKSYRHTQIDIRYLLMLAGVVLENQKIRDRLRYYPSTCIWRLGRFVRMLQPLGSGEHRRYRVVDFESSEALESVLLLAKDGPSRCDLISALSSSDGSDGNAAGQFVDELIANSVLTPSIYPVLSSENPALEFVNGLEHIPDASTFTSTLREVLKTLRQLDSDGIGAEISRYTAVAGTLKELVPAFGQKDSSLFHVELVRPSSGTEIGAEIINAIKDGVMTLHRMAVPNSVQWSQFKAAFTERFEGSEIPLLEALDTEAGVPFSAAPATKPEGIRHEWEPEIPQSPARSVGPRDEYLLRLVFNSVARGQAEVVLSATDVAFLETAKPVPLLDSFSVFATLLGKSARDIRNGEYRFEISGYVQSASVFGRLCATDPLLCANVKSLMEEEEALHSDAIYADVVHYPSGEILGNILRHPRLNPYEIPLLGRSGAPPEFQVPVHDLLVSIRDNRVVLRSKSRGKRVIPRIANAHSFQNPRNLPVYQFLGALQYQDAPVVPVWNWGPLLGRLPFLPRLIHGKLILAMAKWYIENSEIASLTEAKDDLHRFDAVARIAEARKLPRFVILEDADQRLPFDLHNIASINSLVHLIRKRSWAILTELSMESGTAVEGPEGSFRHELVIPFIKTQNPNHRQDFSVKTSPQSTLVRSFPPGSEWLYVKVYSSPAFVDELLALCISPLVKFLQRANMIDKWFFVRYRDNHDHVRLRFHAAGGVSYADLLAQLTIHLLRFIDASRFWRFQFDIYAREVDRYGGPDGISLAESMFHADSESVLTQIMTGTLTNPDERLLFAIAGVHDLLTACKMDLGQRNEFTRERRDAFSAEFNLSKKRRVALGDGFRKLRPEIDLLTSSMTSRYPALAERSSRIAQTILNLEACSHDGRLSKPPLEIMGSLIHMNINRAFRSDQRLHELVVYDYLSRSYDSFRARGMNMIYTDGVVG